MRKIFALAVLIGVAPVIARAECQADIGSAKARADALPESKGKAALLEQLLRASVAHHEGDEPGCREALAVAVSVLDRIDAAKREQARAETAKPQTSAPANR